jgi:hypothetical protein
VTIAFIMAPALIVPGKLHAPPIQGDAENGLQARDDDNHRENRQRLGRPDKGKALVDQPGDQSLAAASRHADAAQQRQQENDRQALGQSNQRRPCDQHREAPAQPGQQIVEQFEMQVHQRA